ncbi:hypothetical protein HII36_11650 [Nonomuraea sp. NN258]|uniref:hypothetical protein n=1 Tax=Nonomuraea antri TaxID=2730852 RepID=UPI001569D5EC|nr:hypothetical protein [Nonomuraea antri]NRQ32488.1 hypothetical protein [Nonomuraea antri]
MTDLTFWMRTRLDRIIIRVPDGHPGDVLAQGPRQRRAARPGRRSPGDHAATEAVWDDQAAGSGSEPNVTTYEYLAGVAYYGEFTLDEYRTWTRAEVRALESVSNRSVCNRGADGDKPADSSTGKVAVTGVAGAAVLGPGSLAGTAVVTARMEGMAETRTSASTGRAGRAEANGDAEFRATNRVRAGERSCCGWRARGAVTETGGAHLIPYGKLGYYQDELRVWAPIAAAYDDDCVGTALAA